eukprot:1159827-Pelagomonas_calceolata.AAC.10
MVGKAATHHHGVHADGAGLWMQRPYILEGMLEALGDSAVVPAVWRIFTCDPEQVLALVSMQQPHALEGMLEALGDSAVVPAVWRTFTCDPEQVLALVSVQQPHALEGTLEALGDSLVVQDLCALNIIVGHSFLLWAFYFVVAVAVVAVVVVVVVVVLVVVVLVVVLAPQTLPTSSPSHACTRPAGCACNGKPDALVDAKHRKHYPPVACHTLAHAQQDAQGLHYMKKSDMLVDAEHRTSTHQ